MTHLIDWPRATAFGRVIPKAKIYEHADADTRLKDLFVREVEQIVWAHKLAPDTVNLSATKSVVEIQVFRIRLKTRAPSHDVLRAIDRAIPYPLIFELAHGGRIRLAAAYKRPSEADSRKWVVGEYFESSWFAEDAPRAPLPISLDMGALYERLVTPLVAEQTAGLTMPAESHRPAMGEAPQAPFTPAGAVDGHSSLQDRIDHAEAVRAKAREVDRIKARLAREKQFNKRVAINAELRAAKQALERLTAGAAATSVNTD
jgi:hypothetical protein